MDYLYKLDATSLGLTTAMLFDEMGYGNIPPDDEIVGLTNSLLAEAVGYAAPACTFKLYDGHVDATDVCLDEGSVLHTSAVISSLLKGSERFVLFAATAGKSYQAYQNTIKAEGDILKCFIADTIGTCIVESAGDQMERLLEKETGGMRHTNRFSPGYCGWHLTGQKELFRLLGGSPCDIELSDVCLMMPIKSISGVIGMGPEVTEKKYGCQYCELETCYKRKQIARKMNQKFKQEA